MLGRLAFGAALAALLVCANSGVARAGDDDNDSFLSKFERTLGLKNPNAMEYGINYSERSPLVVPPNRNLPAPISSNREPANWPQDPDKLKHQADKAAEKVHVEGDRVIDEGRPLRPDELTPKGAGSSSASSGDTIGQPHKSNLLTFDWFKKEEYGTFTGEPTRSSLTDPPPGYQTPSPDQPYGIPPEHKAAKPQTLGERMEPVR
jgi:hypothetical protein